MVVFKMARRTAGLAPAARLAPLMVLGSNRGKTQAVRALLWMGFSCPRGPSPRGEQGALARRERSERFPEGRTRSIHASSSTPALDAGAPGGRQLPAEPEDP